MSTTQQADEQTRKTYDAIKAKFGKVPNIFKGMANSPVALAAYLQLDELISRRQFYRPRSRTLCVWWSASATAAIIACPPTPWGLGANGLKEDAILWVRKGKSEDPKLSALIVFYPESTRSRGTGFR